jgi:hypothetical protein
MLPPAGLGILNALVSRGRMTYAEADFSDRIVLTTTYRSYTDRQRRE